MSGSQFFEDREEVFASIAILCAAGQTGGPSCGSAAPSPSLAASRAFSFQR